MILLAINLYCLAVYGAEPPYTCPITLKDCRMLQHVWPGSACLPIVKPRARHAITPDWPKGGAL